MAVTAGGRSSAGFTLQLLSSITNMRVSQAGLEAWVVNTPNFRASQVGIEVWRTTATAVTVEVKVNVAAQSTVPNQAIAGVKIAVTVAGQSKVLPRAASGTAQPVLYTVT